MFETDLGSVIFGPLDILDSISDAPSPSEMAEMIEQVIELMADSRIIQVAEKTKLYDLVADLRQLPDDLPPPEEYDDPSEHPMMDLMMEKGDGSVFDIPCIPKLIKEDHTLKATWLQR